MFTGVSLPRLQPPPNFRYHAPSPWKGRVDNRYLAVTRVEPLEDRALCITSPPTQGGFKDHDRSLERMADHCNGYKK